MQTVRINPSFSPASVSCSRLLQGFDQVADLGLPGAHYVLVVPVCRKTGRVVMVCKTKPRWQAGLLNYPGGKIEAGETPRGAAIRELKEETALDALPTELRPLAVLSRPGDFRMHVFAAGIDDAQDARTTTEEPVELIPLLDLVTAKRASLENTGWLALMALDGNPTPKIAEIVYE